MKHSLWIALASFLFSACVLAQEDIASRVAEPQIVERGAHHRIWERTVTETLPDGSVVERTSSYVELATGLHYQDERGEWIESSEEIELFDGAAVARQGPFQVIWSANVNTAGGIDLLMPDGQRLRSHVLGLGVFDPSTGQSELVAELKDSIGELHPPNQIYYRNAFDGVSADLRYTYRKSGFVQDVIVREGFTLPAGYNPATTRLEIWTEFIEAPAPDKTARQRSNMTDETLNFGAMQMIPGTAFALEEQEPAARSAPVAKRWMQIDGRTFLIEAVQFHAVKPELDQLPAAKQQAALRRPQGPQMARVGADHRPFPAARKARAKDAGGRIQTASLPPPRQGLVLDYELVSGSTALLKADTTYYVSGTFYVAPTFEGGCVIKFAPTNNASLNHGGGAPVFLTDAYRPVILTARDDHTVGEKIGTNVLNGFYANPAFSGGGIEQYQHLRISYAKVGIACDDDNFSLRHSQFVHCDTAIKRVNGANYATLENVLLHDVRVGFDNASGTDGMIVTGTHLTVNICSNLTANGTSNYSSVTLTNSLLVAVTNNGPFLLVTSFVATASSPATVFQTVGAAAHYLATSSPHRNAGTTNIGATLLSDLKLRTTFPPVVVTTNITGNTTFSPQAQRDTNSPDLGFHYDPIDYVSSQITLTNSTLTVQPGTVLGFYGASNTHGLILRSGGKLISVGSPTNLIRVTRYNLAQEQATTNWSASTVGRSIGTPAPYSTNLSATEGRFRFTEWSMPANGNDHFYAGATNLTLSFQDSQFRGGQLTAVEPNLMLTNNLFERVVVKLTAAKNPFTAMVRNGTFFGGSISLSNGVNAGWTFMDNLFDTTNITQIGKVTNNYNAYLTNSVRLTNNGANDVLLTVSNFTYDTGWLGRYYLPTNSALTNRGSQNATNAGLYHYTTATNQVKETNSTVDIGFHYVAVDGNGLALDSDGDGSPDYVEDPNGNGLTGSGESSFANPVLTIVSPINYIKTSPPKRLDTNAVAYDLDSLNFGGGRLTVSMTSGAEASDRLSIRNQGTNAGQISVTATNVRYGNIIIATNSGGVGTNALVLTFNTNAVNAGVQALARNLTFQNVSNNPANSNRVVKFELTDGKGGTNALTTQTINIICPAAIDAMVVIDISQSLSAPDFQKAKEAASNFVSHLDFSADRVGLVTFAGYAYLNSPLTNNGPAVQNMIFGLGTTNGTTFHYAFDLARSNLTQTASNTLPLLVLLSDGRMGTTNGASNPPQSQIDTNTMFATNAAIAVKDAGIRLITIAYGTNGGANNGTNLMKIFASSTNDFFYAPTATEIDSNFTAIAQGVCREAVRSPLLVTITNPVTNSVYLLPTNMVVTAVVSNGTPTLVEFFNASTKIGQVVNSPYTITWTNPPAGTNALTARTTDSLGLFATSAVVNVIVRAPPSVSIVAPTDAAAFASVMNLLVRASTADVDGWVTNVQFFTNNVASVNVTNPPFQFPWTNLSNSTFTVRAVARDNHGYTNSSGTVTFNVDACPQVGLSNLTLSSSTIVGGSNMTATVTLSNAAPAGGQVVTLLSASPNVSIPASVLVPAGTNKASFNIDTYTVTNEDSAGITASTPLKTNSANLSIQAAAFQSASYANQCGPMDVVVLLDVSSSLDPTLAAVKGAITNILDSVQFASGGDYRLALVSFDQDIYVNEPFGFTNRISFANQLSLLQITSGNSDEPSDEALNTVINALSATGRPRQHGEFTNEFRSFARKIVILITDEPPMGFSGGYQPGIDDVNAHQRAVEAGLKGIRICPLVVTTGHSGGTFHDPVVIAISEDYAAVTGGTALLVNPAATVDVHLAIQRVIGQCGADMGEVVVARDDLRQWNHIAINLNNGQHYSSPLDPASFDLSGLEGPVVAAQFQRTGRLRANYGGRFDLNLGLVSVADTNLAFFALPALTAQTNAIGAAYATNWNLPFRFYSDIQQTLGSIYSVDLVDRASTVCGNNFDVLDTPQSDWPSNRNTLTFKTLARFEIAQGRCRDFVLTGTNAPCGEPLSLCSGAWEIRLFNEVIASECSPHGWSVESDHSAYGGVIVCAPADALTASRYEVRFLEGGTNARSGYLSVVPDGFLPSAPVLRPLEISLPTCSSNTAVTVTVSLDAPAREQEAFVSLAVNGIVNSNIPPYVRIPMGQTTASFTFRPSPVNGDTPFEIIANYNGQRRAAGKVIQEPASMSEFDIAAESNSRRIAVIWDEVPGALYYQIERAEDQSFSPPVLLAQGLTRPCYVDEHPLDGQNCYRVTAVNSFTTTASQDLSSSNCATYSASIPLRPRITPHGGRFNDSVEVTITCETTNATIRYTTDGTVPTSTIGADYTGSILLYDSAQIIAKAFVGGTGSLDDRADFHVSQPTPIQCGETIASMLATTNQPSVVKGSGFYGARYGFTGRKGDVVNVVGTYQDFDADLNLRDPSKAVVAQSDIAITTGLGIRPGINHTLRDDGLYVFEVTSARQGATGNFSVQLTCTPSPELDVFFGTTNVLSGASYDLGLVSTGATPQLTFWITNSGSDTLAFSSLSIAPGLFTISPAISSTNLATNTAFNLTVTFHATNTGPQTGTLTLANNDEFDDSPTGIEIDDPFVINFAAFVNPPGGMPIVYPTSLTNGQVVTTPPTIALMARAISTNGAGITQVQFRVSGPSTLVANGTLVSDVPTNGGWQYDWASAPGGSYTLRAMATDAGGRIAFSTNVSFTINNPPVAVDDAIEFTMNSTNDVNVLANDSDPNGHAFTVTQLLDAPTRGFTNLVDGVVYYAPSNNVFGRDSFRYVIADIHGAKATGTVSVLIRPGGSNYVVNYTNSTQIAQPSNHVEIIGATNVIGTAHSDFLDYWKLEYRRRGGARSVWTQIATGTTNVWSGLLGVFDPTGLPNGQYDLRVTLHDLFGSWQDSETTVLVTENNKIGHFTLSFTDLQIPVSGLPITLTRTYDSRMMEVGDFGVGWNLDVSSVRLEKSGLMGKGWGASAGTDSIGRAFAGVQETETHTVSIVFPDGKVYRFRPEVWLGKEQNWTGATHLSAGEANVIYTNLPGTVGTLRELNPPSYLALGYVAMNEPVTLHDVRPNPYETGDTNDFGPFYDPQEFEFTTLDGRKFQFNAAGKVIRMMDRVGNALEFRADGIIHTNSGKSVKFIRDAAGRIEEIYDPNGLNTAGQPSGPPAMQYKYDGAGNLENALRLNTRNATNPAYLTTTMGYTNAKYPHYLTDITDPRGIKAIRNEYGDDGRLKSMTDASGKTINYIHSVSNRTEIIVDRLSRTNTFVYDTKGNVTESVNPLGHTNRFTYDANGNQLTHTDPLGHITTNTFDANDNLLSVTLPHKPGENPAAFTTRFTYDASGELTSTILPTGGVLTSVVDPDSGNLLQALAGTNLITSFVYDANGNVTAEGDRFGTNGFAYDAYGNALRMTNTLGQVIESGYDPNGNLTNLIDNGVTSSFQLDALGREAFSDYGNGITLSNSFDSHLDWTSVDAPTIGHMERRFDEQGRLAGWKTVNGATPGFAYNDNGQLEYETNSVGVVTYYTYDAAGRIAATTNLATAAGNAFAFDAAGRKVFEVNALGHATGYAFNPDGSLAAMTNAFGTNVWTYSYETGGGCCGGNGASASVTDPLGRVSKTVRSPYGLPLEAIFTSGSLSATSKTAYISGMVSPDQEAEEYPATITDEGGRTRTNSYTSLGQLETATDLGGNRWTNKYDSTSGAVTQIVNPLGSNHLKYIYDTLDNVRTLIFADGGALTNFYDSANRLNGSRLPSGTLVTNFFDSAGRLTNRQAKVNGMLTESVAFGYNSGDAVTIMIDNTGGTTNLYDSAGRFMGSDYPTGASVRYARDLLDRIIAITNKASGGGSNYVTQYRYDAVGNVTNVIDHWGGNTYLEYDQVNRRTKRTLPNGVVSEWQYDWRDRVTNITHKISSTTLASVGYMRASGGEPTRITREDGSYVLLAYDSALRLTNEIFHSSGGAPQSTNGYGYDAAGTRIRLVKAGLAYTNAVTQGYRVTQVKTNGIVAESYDYDLSGRVTNVVRDGVTQRLGYNSADQLVAVTNGSAWTQYVHDGGGRRSKATDQAGAERRFLVAPTAGADLESPHLIADSGNTLKQVYLHLEDQPLMRFDGSGGNSRTYYLEDGMGSVIGIVPHTSPGTGNTSRLFYDGFGNSRTTNGPAPTIPAGTGGDFRFHGLWQETNSGLYHVRARDYDPRTGRFLSRDPVEGDARVPESLYPYSYASSNPHLYSDPSGQFSVIEISITGAKQITFQTFRQLAVAKAKAWAKDKISDFLLDQLVSTLSGLLPIDINALFAEGRSRAGFKFEDMVLGPICDVLGEAGDIFWLGPKVSKGGTVYDNGVNCDGFEERPVGPTGVRGLARPDFIISTKPPVERGKYHNQSLVIGDVKLSGALHSYLNGRQRTQFDAIVSYSSKYTLSRSALFITVWSGKSKHHKAISKQLEQHARGKGVLFVVLSLDDVTPSKRKR